MKVKSASPNPSEKVPPDFALRPGREEDFEFARGLYISSMQPLLTALKAWNEETVESNFRSYYDPEEVRIITENDEDVGWIQVSVSDQEYCLDQLHLVEAAQGRGIGTFLIKAIIADATRENKNVSLSLVKGNHAINLYRRLGFVQVAEDSTKIHKCYVTNESK